MPGVSGVTVVTNARVYYTPRAAAGAPGARHSLRPLFSEGSTFRIKLGRIARRDRESVFVNDGCCLKFESAAHPCYASSARRDPTNNDRCWLEPKWSIIVPKREAAASRWAQLRSLRGSGSRRACHRARIRAPRWLGPDDVERWGGVAGWLAITVSERSLRPEWYAFKRATRMFRLPCVFERRRKILFAFALEFFLGGFEIGYAYGNFFPLPSEAILRFSHAHPFSSRVPRPLMSAIGA